MKSLFLKTILFSLFFAGYLSSSVLSLEETGLIETGLVVAFGKKVRPPYAVVLKGDTVYINDIAFFPLGPDPKRPKAEIIPTEKQKRKHGAIQECYKKYNQYRSSGGKQYAQEKLLNDYRGHPFIRKLSFINEDMIKLDFKDNDSEVLLLNTESELFADKEAIKNRKQQADSVISMLREDKVFIFGYGYSIFEPRKEYKQELDKVLSSLQKGTLSKRDARQLIQKMYPGAIYNKLVEDILRN